MQQSLEQLRKDREAFAAERQELIQQMVFQGERIGKLETELRQLQAPKQNSETNGRTSNQFEHEEESSQAGGQVGEEESGEHEGWQVE